MSRQRLLDFLPLGLLTFLVFALVGHLSAQTPGPQAGQKVAFLGDSITQFGWANPGGYVHLVDMGLQQQGRDIDVIPAGAGGNTSKDMLARLGRDVLSKKPDWMTLSCGVNDVWHGASGVPLDQYQTNITSIVDQATAAGIKVALFTSTMITEDQAAPNNQKLIAYNDFLRGLAQKDNLLLIDLNADMQAALAAIRAKNPGMKGNLLTIDGVHMTGVGDEMMAAGILKGFGFTDAQLAQARDAWLDLPGGMTLAPKAALSVRQYLQMQDLAARQGRTVDEVINDALTKDVQALLIASASGKLPPADPKTPAPASGSATP